MGEVPAVCRDPLVGIDAQITEACDAAMETPAEPRSTEQVTSTPEERSAAAALAAGRLRAMTRTR